MTDNEISLIRLAQKGDAKAFGDLVEKYDDKVMNLALSILGSREDAQDVYQEVFIKVFKALKTFRFQCEFFTWLYRITLNTCLSYRKNRQRKRTMIPARIEDNPENMYDMPDQNGTGPHENVMDTEMSDKLREAVDELPPKQKAVVILRHYQQMKIRQIADIMELNEGTVKGYLFRAAKTLKTKLEPYFLRGA